MKLCKSPYDYKPTPRLAAILDDWRTEEWCEEDGVLNVYFPHWCEITPGVVDREAVSYWAVGACAILARFLFEADPKNNSPALVLGQGLADPTQNWLHAGIINSEGQWVDIDGASDPEEVARDWRRSVKDAAIHICSSFAEFEDFVGDEWNVHSESELAISEDMARLVLAQI